MSDDERDDILNKIRYIAGRPMYMDKFGRPLTLMEWAKLTEDLEYKRVGYTDLEPTILVPTRSYVSTVWLGLDHNFWPGPPLLFETMRFSHESVGSSILPGTYHPCCEFPDPEDPKERVEQIRYSTEEQARLGHARIIKLIQELEMQ